MEALRWDHSVLERAMAKLMAVPAQRLLRSRRVTFLAAHDAAADGRCSCAAPTRARSWCSGSRPTRSAQVELVVGLS